MRLAMIWVLALLLAGPVRAQDYIETSGPLPDEDFYRLVACAAPPRGPCAKPAVRWPLGTVLKVAIARIDRAFLGRPQARARAALARAVQYLNTAGANIQLVQSNSPAEADIRLYFVDNDGRAPLLGKGIRGFEGALVRGGAVRIWWDQTGVIQGANIVFTRRLAISDYESALLEELTQSLGLMTDIKNSHYNGLSVFAEDSNAAKQLAPQDKMALRRHYPADETGLRQSR